MTKNEYMKILKESLDTYNLANIQEILSDYEEHFAHGLQKGKSESEIITKLGNPKAVAKAYKAENLLSQVNDPQRSFQWSTAFNVIGRLLVLAPFNLLVLFVPGVVIFALLVTGWAISVSFAGSSLFLIAIGFTAGLIGLSFWSALGFGSASLGLLGLSALVGIVMFVISKYTLIALIHYLRWNAKFLLEK